MSNRTKKFYKPGTLQEKGTKISLKTQPYINGIVFDPQDPIASFHYYLIAMKVIVEEYEMMRNIPGISDAIPTALDLRNGLTGKVKLLLQYLAQSPIEITLKEQLVTQELLNELSLQGERNE